MDLQHFAVRPTLAVIRPATAENLRLLGRIDIRHVLIDDPSAVVHKGALSEVRGGAAAEDDLLKKRRQPLLLGPVAAGFHAVPVFVVAIEAALGGVIVAGRTGGPELRKLGVKAAGGTAAGGLRQCQPHAEPSEEAVQAGEQGTGVARTDRPPREPHILNERVRLPRYWLASSRTDYTSRLRNV